MISEKDYLEAAEHLHEMMYPNDQKGKSYFKQFPGEKTHYIAIVKKLKEYFDFKEAN